MPGNYRAFVDWNNDGEFLASNEDISAYVLEMDCALGRDYASQLTGRSTAGRASLALDNRDGRFNSLNQLSPLYGSIKPGRLVRIALDYYAASFVGSGGYLTVAHNADLATGNVDFCWVTWVYLTAKPAAQQIVLTKGTPGTDDEYTVYWDTALDRFVFQFTNAGAKQVIANTFGVPPLNTWCCIIASWTASNSTASIRVNHGAHDLAVHAVDPVAGTENVFVGANDSGGQNLNGRVGLTGFWKRTLTTDEQEWIFNRGGGRRYKELGHRGSVGSAMLTSLIGYWELWESAGSARSEPVNGYQLTEAGGTVARAYGPPAPLWTGYLDHIEPDPRISRAHRAMLRASGPLARLAERDATIPMSANITTGAAVAVVLDEADWTDRDRRIEPGQYTIGRWFSGTEGRVSAFGALRELEDTEFGFLREDKDGAIAFEDRHHRLLDTLSLNVQQTYRDDAVGVRLTSIQAHDELDEIWNAARVEVRSYTVGVEAVLWEHPEAASDPPVIAPGDAIEFWAEYPDSGAASGAVGVNAWTTPVVGTDIIANSQADGLGTDISASLTIAVDKFDRSMKIRVTNGHATSVAHLRTVQAKGTPITENEAAVIKRPDSTTEPTASQSAYGRREFPVPGPFLQESHNAIAYADMVIYVYQDAIEKFTMEIRARDDDTHHLEVIERDVSDLVVYNSSTVTRMTVAANFFIEAIRHRISQAGNDHRMQIDWSRASAWADFWILGTDELGVGTRLIF